VVSVLVLVEVVPAGRADGERVNATAAGVVSRRETHADHPGLAR